MFWSEFPRQAAGQWVGQKQNQASFVESTRQKTSAEVSVGRYEPQLRHASLFSRLHTRAAILRSASISGSATTALATATLALAESVAMTFCVLGVCCSCSKEQRSDIVLAYKGNGYCNCRVPEPDLQEGVTKQVQSETMHRLVVQAHCSHRAAFPVTACARHKK